MRSIHTIFCLTILAAVCSAGAAGYDCTQYRVLDSGLCNSTALDYIQKAAVAACQSTTDIIDFTTQLQSLVDSDGFSALAVTDIDDVGFFICISDPCYVSATVGPVGIFSVFVGGPGPCDGTNSVGFGSRNKQK